jgi:HlyD family secretion protein
MAGTFNGHFYSMCRNKLLKNSVHSILKKIYCNRFKLTGITTVHEAFLNIYHEGIRSVNKKLYIGAALLVIIVIAIAYSFRKNTQQDKYETAIIDRGDIIEKITATGTINPVNSVKVGSQVSGRIIKILADYNSQVKKGQVVAQLETDIYQSKVAQADANYKMSQAQVKEAKAMMADSESNLRRANKLNRDQVLSERELEIAETKYDSAKASYGAAVAREEQSNALLISAQLDLQHTTIYSPVDGIVISRNCDVGQTVVATFQTPDLFLIAEDLTKMRVDAYVDEADIGKAKVGQQVLFTVDAYPDQVFNGTISQVRFAPKELQNVVSYATLIEVPNPELMLRPGMTASISIIVEHKKNVMRVANAALRFKPDSADKELARNEAPAGSEASAGEDEMKTQHRVWVVDKDVRVQTVNIKTGIYDTRHAEITGGDIKEGQTVIIGYQPQWRQTDSSKSMFKFGQR